LGASFVVCVFVVAASICVFGGGVAGGEDRDDSFGYGGVVSGARERRIMKERNEEKNVKQCMVAIV
jgi:hypothetical protein